MTRKLGGYEEIRMSGCSILERWLHCPFVVKKIIYVHCFHFYHLHLLTSHGVWRVDAVANHRRFNT